MVYTIWVTKYGKRRIGGIYAATSVAIGDADVRTVVWRMATGDADVHTADPCMAAYGDWRCGRIGVKRPDFGGTVPLLGYSSSCPALH